MADVTSADIMQVFESQREYEARKAKIAADFNKTIADLEAQLEQQRADCKRILAELATKDEAAKKFQAEVFEPAKAKMEAATAEWNKARGTLEGLRNAGNAGYGRERFNAANRAYWNTHTRLQVERNQTRSMVQRHSAFGEQKELSRYGQ